MGTHKKYTSHRALRETRQNIDRIARSTYYESKRPAKYNISTRSIVRSVLCDAGDTSLLRSITFRTRAITVENTDRTKCLQIHAFLPLRSMRSILLQGSFVSVERAAHILRDLISGLEVRTSSKPPQRSLKPQNSLSRRPLGPHQFASAQNDFTEGWFGGPGE